MSSWWFGSRNKTQFPDVPAAADGNAAPSTAGQTSGDTQLTSAERKAMEAYRFDSSALERAAAAAKTLERSSKFTVSVLSPNGVFFLL